MKRLFLAMVMVGLIAGVAGAEGMGKIADSPITGTRLMTADEVLMVDCIERIERAVVVIRQALENTAQLTDKGKGIRAGYYMQFDVGAIAVRLFDEAKRMKIPIGCTYQISADKVCPMCARYMMEMTKPWQLWICDQCGYSLCADKFNQVKGGD
ncbi:MAG: hypothetical protein WC623_24050 [Pedobacter sp.]|uniref:hypothetical protein n=1 Tax=Pedobacter sp. TaxID=1411316 RepID=UPI00356197D8